MARAEMRGQEIILARLTRKRRCIIVGRNLGYISFSTWRIYINYAGEDAHTENIAYNDDKQHRCYLLIAAVAPAPPSRLIIYHLVIATRLIVMDSCSNGPIIVPFVILRAGSSLYRDLSGLICHHLVFIIR